jgi:hypothetical protein
MIRADFDESYQNVPKSTHIAWKKVVQKRGVKNREFLFFPQKKGT